MQITCGVWYVCTYNLNQKYPKAWHILSSINWSTMVKNHSKRLPIYYFISRYLQKTYNKKTLTIKTIHCVLWLSGLIYFKLQSIFLFPISVLLQNLTHHTLHILKHYFVLYNTTTLNFNRKTGTLKKCIFYLDIHQEFIPTYLWYCS